jgi:hypothetical protein
MLGNPYEFVTFYEQEYAFTIPADMDKIDELVVNFY